MGPASKRLDDLKPGERDLRDIGLRPKQEADDAAFRAEAHRQSALVAASADADDDQRFIDSVSWLADDE